MGKQVKETQIALKSYFRIIQYLMLVIGQTEIFYLFLNVAISIFLELSRQLSKWKMEYNEVHDTQRTRHFNQ